MSLRNNYDDSQSVSEYSFEKELDDVKQSDDSDHKREVRRLLEERLENKRLKEELEDEFDADFNWDSLD